MSQPFVAKDVIDYLDTCIIDEPYCFFMDLEHGYFHTANSRLTLYADGVHWAIVFEKNGYANRGGRIEFELNYFGNCLRTLDRAGADDRYVCNAKYVTLADGEALQAIASDFEQVSLDASRVIVRGQSVPLPPAMAGFARWIPDIEDDKGFPGRPNFCDLARYLAFEHADLCRATDAEKRMCLPPDLPHLMMIDAWHHRSYHHYRNGTDDELIGDAPSTYETFPLIAEVLAARDPSRFRPTLPANNHWSNWPVAGAL